MQLKINKNLFIQISILIITFLLTLFIAIYLPIGHFNPFSQSQSESVYKYSTLQSNSIDNTYFNNVEISHLNDVRNVFSIIWIILFINLIFIYLNKEQFLKRIVNFWKVNLIITVILSLIISILALFDFRNMFIFFHQIFFPQGNWYFNSANSNLIKLFPEEIFISFLNYYAIIFVLSLLITSFEIVLWKKILKIKKS